MASHQGRLYHCGAVAPKRSTFADANRNRDFRVFSGLFEAWRVVQASAISWFYEGAGGSFDYWPDGLDGPMLSEQPPFGNVALISDNDQLYHRIGPIGNGNEQLPQISASAKIQPNGEDDCNPSRGEQGHRLH